MVFRFFAAASLLGMGLSLATAQDVRYLDFEGLENNDEVAGYYNGVQGGPDLDIVFRNALALRDNDVGSGGSGNFANEPSPDTIAFFLVVNDATMNVLDGFEDGVNFWYTTVDFSGFVNVYDGLDGTGNLLGSQPLSALGSDPSAGDPSGDFNRWANIAVPLNTGEVGRSVVFSGTQNQLGLDDVRFGTVFVPEPSGPVVTLVGVFAAILSLRKRRHCPLSKGHLAARIDT